MTALLDQARYDAIQEIASALLKVSGDVRASHGNDPNGVAILGAGFAMALKETRKIDPLICRIVVELLTD